MVDVMARRDTVACEHFAGVRSHAVILLPRLDVWPVPARRSDVPPRWADIGDWLAAHTLASSMRVTII